MPSSLQARQIGNTLAEAMETMGFYKGEFMIERRDDRAKRRLEFNISHRYCPADFGLVSNIGSSVLLLNYAAPDQPVREHATVIELRSMAGHFRSWLADLREYLDTPDLLTDIWKGMQLNRGALVEGDTATFSPAEQAEIVHQLEQMRADARVEPSLTEAQLQSVESGISYLADAVTRLGRGAWLGVAVGTFSSWLLADTIPAETLRRIVYGVGSLVRARWPHLLPP